MQGLHAVQMELAIEVSTGHNSKNLGHHKWIKRDYKSIKCITNL